MIRLAESDEDIRSCHPVMRQLRPNHDELGPFVARIRMQQREGYRLALLEERGRAVAVAGYRIGHNLAWGKYLYVDDLVTDEATRSAGHGRQLLEWLARTATEDRCEELHLDSGVQRFGAHRFYLREGMDITSHHFALTLRRPVE